MADAFRFTPTKPITHDSCRTWQPQLAGLLGRVGVLLDIKQSILSRLQLEMFGYGTNNYEADL